PRCRVPRVRGAAPQDGERLCASNPRHSSRCETGALPAPGPQGAAVEKSLSTTSSHGCPGSYFLRCGVQNGADHAGHFVPFASLRLEPPPANRGEPVITSATIIVTLAPVAGDPALMLQPVERRVERALRHLKAISGNLLNPQE